MGALFSLDIFPQVCLAVILFFCLNLIVLNFVLLKSNMFLYKTEVLNNSIKIIGINMFEDSSWPNSKKLKLRFFGYLL